MFAAAAAAACVSVLTATGNLFTDAAMVDLVQLLQSLPAADQVSALDLSHNQLLTWQCCEVLSQLLSAAAAAADAGHQGCSTTERGTCLRVQEVQSAGVSMQQHMQTAEGSGGDLVHAAPPRLPAGWCIPRPSFKRMVQPLQLQALHLQGVSVGDKGAVLLASGLAGTRHLQVGAEGSQQHDGSSLCMCAQIVAF